MKFRICISICLILALHIFGQFNIPDYGTHPEHTVYVTTFEEAETLYTENPGAPPVSIKLQVRKLHSRSGNIFIYEVAPRLGWEGNESDWGKSALIQSKEELPLTQDIAMVLSPIYNSIADYDLLWFQLLQ